MRLLKPRYKKSRFYHLSNWIFLHINSVQILIQIFLMPLYMPVVDFKNTGHRNKRLYFRWGSANKSKYYELMRKPGSSYPMLHF